MSTSEIISKNYTDAITFVSDRAGSDLKLTDNQKLEVYALYKQVENGDAKKEDKPSAFNLVRRARYDAWKSLAGIGNEKAKEEYGVLIGSLNAGFVLREYDTDTDEEDSEEEEIGKKEKPNSPPKKNSDRLQRRPSMLSNLGASIGIGGGASKLVRNDSKTLNRRPSMLTMSPTSAQNRMIT